MKLTKVVISVGIFLVVLLVTLSPAIAVENGMYNEIEHKRKVELLIVGYASLPIPIVQITYEFQK